MERGRCWDALDWLLRTQSLRIENGDVVAASVRYLELTSLEDPLSRAYYMMYYVEIMEKAANQRDTVISDAMHQALLREKRMFREFFNPVNREDAVRPDSGRSVRRFQDLFSSGSALQRRYHPLEIVLWKYGSYLAITGSSLKSAAKHWRRAIDVCDECPDYLALRLVAMAILLEEFKWTTDVKAADAVLALLRKRTASVLALEGLPVRMHDYVQDVQEFAINPPYSAAGEKAMLLSRQIAF